jgi:hypothetical protein
MLSPSGVRCPKDRGVPQVEITKSKGVSSSAEELFDRLLTESVSQVFGGTLGPIAGQALLDALKKHTSLELKDIPAKPELLDEALKSHLGSVAGVLERKILRTLTKNAAAGVAPSETERFDFALEVKNIKRQFLRRKQAGNQPQILE